MGIEGGKIKSDSTFTPLNIPRKSSEAEIIGAINLLIPVNYTFVSGNLRNYIRQTERADAKLDKSLDALLDLPDSPQLLQALALLRNLKAGDKNSLRTSERQIVQIGSDEAKAARRIVTAAYRQTPEDFVAKTLPRLDERYRKLRTIYVEQAKDRIAGHPSGPPGLAFIDATLTGVRDKFGVGLTREDYAELELAAQSKRTALRQEIFNKAKTNIDTLAVSHFQSTTENGTNP